jgi:hypothetical protein
MLNSTDADNTDSILIYRITDAVDHGTLVNTNTGTTLTLNSTFTQADLNSGFIRYTHSGSETISDSFQFTVSDRYTTTSASNFNITITPVNDAPNINGWTQVSFENFESGATGWTNNLTTAGGTNFSSFLGRFANDGAGQTNAKTYTLTGTQSQAIIEFDFYRIDSWDTEALRIYINDAQIFTQDFTMTATTIADGSSGIVSWTVQELSTTSGNLGFTAGQNDQIFRFTLTVNSTASSVKLGFGSGLNQAVTDEAYGIDNVRVFEVTSSGTPGPMNIAENSANGTVVGRMTGTDAENNTISWSITGGTGSTAFAINSSTGIITVADVTQLNFESISSFTLTIRATDNGSPAAFSEKNITININDVVENTAPVIGALGPLSVAENTAVNTVIGTASATDAEGNAITWSITAGNTDNLFAINASTGEIRVSNIAALNYEWRTSYTITIRAQDNGFGTLASTRNVVINITDVNEAPTLDENVAPTMNFPYRQYWATTGNFYEYISTGANYCRSTPYSWCWRLCFNHYVGCRECFCKIFSYLHFPLGRGI